MYTYDGDGLLIEIEDPENFLIAYGDATGSYYEDMEELENWGEIGDWCSPDNLDEALRDGYPIDTSGGCLVIRSDDEYGDVDLNAIASALGMTVGELTRKFECNFHVVCWQ